ncbi:MAG: hypothetical protein WBC85_02160 [Planktotalea sp.]|uniref:hypothetical protein n=1 Tax=Planktotalea sp. TaxID=2029877 RepID=UPI003C77731F
MKNVAAALLALTISSGSIAHAGGLTDPVLEQEIIIEQAKAGSSSSAMALVLLTGILMIAVTAQ